MLEATLIPARAVSSQRKQGFIGSHMRLETLYMSSHSNIYEQLVIELYVRDFKVSCAFYQAFGFRMIRDEGDFAELQWEDRLLFLEANPTAPSPPSFPVGNIRILVPNVDDYWTLSQQKGVKVIRSVENRSNGLRDFTIAGPDGLGLRFATRLLDHAS
jgi:catechol 2,3-dioxygenase-like lactoylglutathione lyase family enzyme